MIRQSFFICSQILTNVFLTRSWIFSIYSLIILNLFLIFPIFSW